MSGNRPHSAVLGRFGKRLSATLIATLALLASWAVCTCGCGDGQITKLTISATDSSHS
jgi:hypothetical protein